MMRIKPLAVTLLVVSTIWIISDAPYAFGVEEDDGSVTGTVQQRSLAADVAEMRDLTRAEALDFYTSEVELEYSEWAEQAADHRTWQEMAKRKMLAVRNEGRLHQGVMQYRKGYRSLEKAYPGHKKLERYTYTGMSHESFIKRNRDLFARGYTLMWSQSFADSTGVVYYQGLWAKVMEAPPMTPEAKVSN